MSNGGGDNLENLQALFWRTNRKKGDTLGWKCKRFFNKKYFYYAY
ncbi:MAG: hypothetical protein IPI90_11205 [Saprospiraceae bacterium]|nr:hypothetical protein [Candidatus Vicinibacter affinis]